MKHSYTCLKSSVINFSNMQQGKRTRKIKFSIKRIIKNKAEIINNNFCQIVINTTFFGKAFNKLSKFEQKQNGIDFVLFKNSILEI